MTKAQLLRCKSAASHHNFSSQPAVFPTDRSGVSVLNPPEETAGAQCLCFHVPVFDNQIPNRRHRRSRQSKM